MIELRILREIRTLTDWDNSTHLSICSSLYFCVYFYYCFCFRDLRNIFLHQQATMIEKDFNRKLISKFVKRIWKPIYKKKHFKRINKYIQLWPLNSYNFTPSEVDIIIFTVESPCRSTYCTNLWEVVYYFTRYLL